jgi:hypothetical protein
LGVIFHSHQGGVLHRKRVNPEKRLTPDSADQHRQSTA